MVFGADLMNGEHSVTRGGAIKDFALLRCHHRVSRLRSDDCRNNASLRLRNWFDLTLDQPGGAGVASDPKNAVGIELERADSSGCRPVGRELLNAAAIVFSQTAVS